MVVLLEDFFGQELEPEAVVGTEVSFYSRKSVLKKSNI